MLDSCHDVGHGMSSVYTILTSTTLESNMSRNSYPRSATLSLGRVCGFTGGSHDRWGSREGMPTRKPLRWIGSSREDLCDFPTEVRRTIGYALHFAQMGDTHPSAKPLQGFGGAG